MNCQKKSRKGKNFLGLFGLMILTLVLGGLTPVNGQQNHFIIEPSTLAVGADPGMSVVHLGFAENVEPWSATTEDSWLVIDPPNGNISTNLNINFQPNVGPARTGYIVFQAVRPDFPAFVLEVNQNQGVNSGLVHFQWQQLNYTMVDPMMIPNTGSAMIEYLPWAQPVYLNIFGRIPTTIAPSWLVRNVFLPDASFMADPQNLWLPVDLSLLGYERGQVVTSIEFSWTVSLEPAMVMQNYPDRFWQASPVIPQVVNATGRIGLNPFASVPLLDYYKNLLRPVMVDNLLYIGCDMPNGDLDDGARPGESQGCGPAAAANSLSWLDKKRDEIDVPDNWRDAFNQMSSLMRKKGEGTSDADFIRAKLDFIEMYDLPIKVEYQDDGMEGDITSSSGNSSAKCKDAKAGDMPTSAWMISEAKDGEDVEVGLTYGSGSGHWVVLTGTVSLNGQLYLFYKDDKDQDNPGGNSQGWTPVDVKDGTMELPGMSNAKVDIVVSESYDPKYKPVSDEMPFSKYCQSAKRTLPPGASITLDYPDNPDRCYNTSVRVLNHGEKSGYILKAIWNHNSNKQRTYVNDTGEPVTVEFHNDDHFDGGGAPLKSYVPYTVIARKSLIPGGLPTTPSNEESFAGFSIGTDDDSQAEFGERAETAIDYQVEIGSHFALFPARMGPLGCTRINIQYDIKSRNRYWNHLGLIIGVCQVANPGTLFISSVATGFRDSLSISENGEYFFDIGGVTMYDAFDLTLECDTHLDFAFDNLGVPSLVQVEPVLSLAPDSLALRAGSAGQEKFNILNLGGSDLIWSIIEKPEWIQVFPVNGINDCEVFVDYQANVGTPRMGTILVEAPGARFSPAGITVFQDSSGSGITWLPEIKQELIVFPNPASDVVYLKMNNLPPGNLTCKVLDLIGRELYTDRVRIGNPEVIIPVPLEDFPDGVYFLSVESAKGVIVKKLIKGKR